MNKLVITKEQAGGRLDKTLALLYPEFSRSALERLIADQQILVNNEPSKSKYALKEDDVIDLNFDDLQKTPEQIDLTVLYEDDDVVVINKPIGVLSHSKGNFNKEGTVASWLQTHLARLDIANNREGIVHRLDRATSGVMITAKNAKTATHLQKQFAKRNVKKTYVAIIKGELKSKEGLIDIPIERNPKKPATFRAGANGKSAQTNFKVIKTTETYSLVELKPTTGRTHQLRVHLNYLGHPIVGDDFYGGQSAPRLMLHAQELELTLPGGARTAFTAPLPKEFNQMMS